MRQAADRERTIVTMSALYGLPPAPPHVPSAGCTWEDRRQHRVIWVFALLSLAAAMGAALAWWAGAGVLLVAVVVWLGCLCGTYLLSMVRLRRCRARGRTAWTASPEGVRMLGSRELVAWGLALRLIAALVPLTVLAALLAGDHVPVLAGGLIGVLGLEAAFYLVRIIYRGGPVRPGILLSPVGVQVTRTDSSGDFLPWDREPRVTVVSGRVRIESQGRGLAQFSVWYLPVSCRQLERLLGALGNRPDMQARLGGPEALTMVLDLLEPPRRSTPTPPGLGRVLTPRSATREAVAALEGLEESALVGGIRERLVGLVNGLCGQVVHRLVRGRAGSQRSLRAGGPPPRPGQGWQPTVSAGRRSTVP